MEADRATYTADGNDILVVRVLLSVFTTFTVYNHGEHIGTVRINPDSETTKWIWETPDDEGMLSGWTRNFEASVYRLAKAFTTL